jgi:hypothetical protein
MKRDSSFCFCTAFAAAAIAHLIFSPLLPAQQRSTTGTIAGVVVSEAGTPVAEATILIARIDGSFPREAMSAATGAFAIGALPPGLYRVTARRIGYREARLPSLRIIAGQLTDIRVMLAISPTQLSMVTVRVTATSIDASTTALSRRIEVNDVKLVPTGREASSLVDLVPGAREGFIWGGAGDAANNYQLDGVSVNHPGVGGDFLAPSIDWIEALEVIGLGAGAEYGEFQGGIINAITKTGSNHWLGTLRANYISPSLMTTNIRPFEEGAEQAMRRELSGEMRGAIVRDRLFYFATAQVIDRDVQVPDLTTLLPDDFRASKQEFRELRGLAKLTLRPDIRDRIDGLFGYTGTRVEHAGLNGIDDPAATRRISSPARFYSLDWTHTNPSSSLDVRIAGFNASETRLGYAGDSVPGIEIFSVGREPLFQNAPFNERLKPRSLGGNAAWRTRQAIFSGENRLVIGAEYTRGWWKNERTRSGGLTWLPYPNPVTGLIAPLRPETWADVASEWGGEIRLQSDIEDRAAFIQDYLTPVPGLTIAPGLRYGRWSGWLTPADATKQRFLAARHQAFDPRIGIVWDISRRNELVLKAHWGRYHQGMNSVFFDRAQGADVYTNQRFYFQGPVFSDPRRVYTPAERDAMLDTNFGFSPTFVESILNEAGRVEDYRQPYIDQSVLGIEKTFGPRWKAELEYTNRVNRDIAGLVDRNLASNYSILRDVTVKQRVTFAPVPDQTGAPLTLPVVYVANDDLRAVLIQRQGPRGLGKPIPGFTFADIGTLTYVPDIALTTVASARRRFDQVSLSLRTEQRDWNGFAAVTATRLRGNVPGLTGFGTNGTTFTAGPAVRPNEAINYEGLLPNVPAFEAKLWVSGKLIYSLQAGAFTTFSLGEYFSPGFQITPRFRFFDKDRGLLEDELFHRVLGQTILLEDRGNRKYQPRSNVDLRLEREFTSGGVEWVATADLFNAMGSDAIIQKNLTINDQVSTDLSSLFAAPRLRVSPRALQVGVRLLF